MGDQRKDRGAPPPAEGDFSLEEILEEFATPRHRSRTARRLTEENLPDNLLLFPRAGGPEVDMPPRPEKKAPPPQGEAPRPRRTRQAPPPEPEKPEPEPEEEQGPDGPEEGEGVVLSMPRRGLLGSLTGLFQRANDYADRMYGQTEADGEALEAEALVPGVDEEEVPPSPGPRKAKRPRPTPPPDLSPGELAEGYRREMGRRRLRSLLALLTTLALFYFSLSLPRPPVLEPLELRVYLLAGGLALAMALCFDVVGRGLKGLFTLRPQAETLPALAACFTLADALTMPLLGLRDGTPPCCGPAALALTAALWGSWHRAAGLRLACRTAASAKEPYRVTCDGGKWSGRPAYSKWSGGLEGFGSQMQEEDFARRVYRVAAPLLTAGCLACSLLSSLGRERPELLLWCLSATFTAASSLSALAAFGLPFHGLARRLSKVGAALGGWAGAERCRSGGILLSDGDLFPPGSVELNGIKVYSDKALPYAATVLRDARCGLAQPFHDLLRSQGGIYRKTTGLRCHEGGVSARIRNQEVLVGSAAFLRLMEVELPQGIHVKSAVFCAIDGRLAGVFALHYQLHPLILPSLTALMGNGVRPVLCTRDPSLIPAFLERKFKLPVDRMEFPPAQRRMELSDPGQDHDPAIAALLCREGLGPFSDAVVGGKRLRLAVRGSALLSAAGSAVGLGLAFYLTWAGAFSALTPGNLLVFLVMWLVPTLLLSHWVGQY